MEEEIGKAKAEAAKLVIEGPTLTEPVAPVSVQTKRMMVPETTPNTTKAQEQELATLKEELAAHEALRAREQELKKAAEEEQRKVVESLQKDEQNFRKSYQMNDRLKEEREAATGKG